jgi:probable rRNA maturation factor
MKKMTDRVEVQIACADAWVPEKADIATWLQRAMCAVRRDTNAEVTVRVVSAAEIQAMNRDFRYQDKATNVLSFPGGAVEGLPSQENVPLGDIVICASVVNTEAKLQRKTASAHWAHMIVHGALHLMGFDHDTESQAVAMESLEIRILDAHGVANPYRESPLET